MGCRDKTVDFFLFHPRGVPLGPLLPVEVSPVAVVPLLDGRDLSAAGHPSSRGRKLLPDNQVEVPVRMRSRSNEVLFSKRLGREESLKCLWVRIANELE